MAHSGDFLTPLPALARQIKIESNVQLGGIRQNYVVLSNGTRLQALPIHSGKIDPWPTSVFRSVALVFKNGIPS